MVRKQKSAQAKDRDSFSAALISHLVALMTCQYYDLSNEQRKTANSGIAPRVLELLTTANVLANRMQRSKLH